jgi:GMP synthase-like glutamine amidotransferase
MILVIKHVENEGPGMIRDFFERSGHKIVTVELEKGERLPKPDGSLEAVVIMGGPMSVHDTDRYPFLKEEEVFIKELVKRDIPLLGVCLGAQMIARALGAEVRKAVKPEIGWHWIGFTENGANDRLFCGLMRKIEVFQWHEDKFGLPKNCVPLAYSSVCSQAFRYGERVYALQFHFEVTVEMVRAWSAEALKKRSMDRFCYMDIIRNMQVNEDHYRFRAYRILENFSKLFSKRE